MPDLVAALPTTDESSANRTVSPEQTPLTIKYAALAALATPEGVTVASYLGAPIGSDSALPAGGRQQRYERGIIVARKSGGVFVVYGEVFAQWYRLGETSGFLGLPLSDQTAAGSGFTQAFDGGDICWSAATGARSIHGAIRDRWLALGGAMGMLGFPTSDENAILSAGKEIGRFNSFASGAGIYWSAATGAWDVHGAIAACWQSYGGPTGGLGLPTSGETNTPDAGGRYNDFSGGIVVWHPSGPYSGAFALFNLVVYLDHFESDFSPIHVQVNIDAHHPDASNHTWFPSNSDYASNPSVQQPLVSLPAINSGTTLDVWMDGLGDHTIGQDERLGIFTRHYDITNLWGTLEDPTHPVNTNVDADHHLNCIFTCRTHPPMDPNVPFRKQYFWPYLNFETDPMPDTTFAQTFADVHEGESAVWHPFDQIFYEAIYKTIGKAGNCFGMCLEALYAMADRSNFTEAIYDDPQNQYPPDVKAGAMPTDGRITLPVNIKHGYQVGDRVVFYFLGEYVAGHTHDPVGAFRRSRAAFKAGDRPIISVTEGSGFGAGHAVLPYAWDDSKSPWTISIANPNAPYSLESDDAAPTCRILVDPSANTFSLAVTSGPGGVWTGSGSGGGRMFHIPFSEMNSEPNTPIDDILALITSSALIILSGAGQTTQITDQHGRTLNGTTTQSRIPNMAPIPLVSDEKKIVDDTTVNHAVRPAALGFPETYALCRPPRFEPVGITAPATPTPENPVGRVPVGPEIETLNEDAILTWEIASTGDTPYVWGLRSPAGSIVATVPANASDVPDILHVQNVVRSLPALTLQAANGVTKTASVILVGPAVEGSAQARIYEVSGIPMSGGAGITLQLSDGGDSLQVVNPAGDATIGVRMQAGPNAANAISRNVLATGSNAAITVAPASWTEGSLATAAVTVKNYDRAGGTLLKQTQF